MQKLALRILSRFSRKSFIRSAWKNLNSLSEHDELAEALETLISMSHEENEFIELITVIVDVLSEAPMASAFLSLPSKETSHKITSRLLQKLKPEQNQREEHVLMHQQFGVFLLRSWQTISKELQSDNGLSADKNRRMQLKFCVEWALKNTFAEVGITGKEFVERNGPGQAKW
ncbi:4265_t:CDS:2 [Entrophospora sp. SA101]|nr:4265_t:CDS:2 [Entrophospora sp. SA101]